MDSDDTLLGMRIGPDPSEVLAIHRARQAHLPGHERAADPSSVERRVQRMRARDDLERGRNAFRRAGGDE